MLPFLWEYAIGDGEKYRRELRFLDDHGAAEAAGGAGGGQTITGLGVGFHGVKQVENDSCAG